MNTEKKGKKDKRAHGHFPIQRPQYSTYWVCGSNTNGRDAVAQMSIPNHLLGIYPAWPSKRTELKTANKHG